MKDLIRSKRRTATFADLQAAAAVGETWAIDALADEYLPRLTTFAAGRGAVDPGGVADVALLSVLNRLDQLHFEAPQQFWAYLCRTVRSRIVDEHRATKPVELIEDDSLLEEGAAVSTPFDEHIAERHYVDGLLSPLTAEQRRILEMRFIDDLSIEETANRTGRTQGAVKGLQRRAINAIIAAVAIVLVVLAVRGFGDSQAVTELDNDPAQRLDVGESEVEEPAPDSGIPDAGSTDSTLGSVAGPNDVGGAVDDTNSSPGTTAGDETSQAPDTDAATDTGAGADGVSTTGEIEAAPPLDQQVKFPVTAGTGRAIQLNTAGAVGSESGHGTRIYCPVSHFSHDDPIRLAGQSGAASAQLYWGNTAVDAFTDGPGLTAVGNGTCEGGVSNRSGYWMPALFDSADQVVIPESVLVEYKSFGGPDFDRSTIQPIPAGLELLAGASLANSTGQLGNPVGGGERSVRFDIKFPSCVATDQFDEPVLSGGAEASHLSYPTNERGVANGCPASHPYRIPQLSYAITYAVPFNSAWYLSSDEGPQNRGNNVTASAISGWQPEAMAAVVRCNRQLLEGCDFIEVDDLGRRLGRSQLPERFASPTGEPVYVGSVTLAEGADRTPFGNSVGQFR
ncbi:MAG: sigma-70 family RNA polymerase sigma factor [Acidimicrobiales bacterium]